MDLYASHRKRHGGGWRCRVAVALYELSHAVSRVADRFDLRPTTVTVYTLDLIHDIGDQFLRHGGWLPE